QPGDIHDLPGQQHRQRGDPDHPAQPAPVGVRARVGGQQLPAHGGRLLLAGGRLADVYGRRRIFLGGLALFTVSSLAAGLATSGGMLIASRAIQGIGAALLMPATLAVIIAAFTNVRERNTAIGIWAAIGALALALGPALGGLISQHLHWGWIF